MELMRYAALMSEILCRSYERVTITMKEEIKENPECAELLTDELYKQAFHMYQVNRKIISTIKKLDTENQLEETIREMEENNDKIAKTLNDQVRESL